jgi:hypothetical protein
LVYSFPVVSVLVSTRDDYLYLLHASCITRRAIQEKKHNLCLTFHSKTTITFTLLKVKRKFPHRFFADIIRETLCCAQNQSCSGTQRGMKCECTIKSKSIGAGNALDALNMPQKALSLLCTRVVVCVWQTNFVCAGFYRAALAFAATGTLIHSCQSCKL